MKLSKYGQYGCLAKVKLIHRHLLDVVKARNEGSPSSQLLRETVLDDVLHVKCDNNKTMFLLHTAYAFIRNKILYFNPGPPISLLFSYSIRYRRCLTAIKASWWGLGTNFL